MKFPPLTVFAISVVFSVVAGLAQSCRLEAIVMKARIQAEPEAALRTLGHYLALNPDCVGELVEAAIEATGGESEALTAIVKLAVLEYPDEVTTVAEAAVLAVPGEVERIRRAFGEAIEEARSRTVEPETPIEKFLAHYEGGRWEGGSAAPPEQISFAELERARVLEEERAIPEAEVTSAEPADREEVVSEDAAVRALQAIDRLLARLTGEEAETPGGEPENLRVDLPDEAIGVMTLNDTLLQVEERIDEPLEEPLVLRDSFHEAPARLP